MANTQEYGLFQLLDLGLLEPNQLVGSADSGLLVSAIQYDAAQHNADVDSLLRLFAMTTSDYQLEVDQSDSSMSQPLDENARAIPVKPPAPYTIALPLQGSGSAWGTNVLTRMQMTNRMLAKTMAKLYVGDYKWVQRHITAQLFSNVSYTHRDILGKGNLTILGPANGDATTYYNQYTQSSATDTHFLAQAAGIADATNPYPTIAAELKEHAVNSGEVIAFIASDLKATTQALTEFHAANLDPDIQLGTTITRLTGTLRANLPPGATILGKTDSGVWIVEWPALPSTYIIAIMTGGPRPLGRRVFDNAAIQGFRAMGDRDDFPYSEQQWQRWEGYGAFNRVGVVVTRIGNAAYAVPTNYGVPMA